MFGRPLRRAEDQMVLEGAAQYVDDLIDSETTRAVFVRSTWAHAEIVQINCSLATQRPGVLGVFTAADLQLPPMSVVYAAPMPGVFDRPVLASDRTRFAGEAIAIVVAETLAQAVDAAEYVEVEYEDVPAVVGVEQAMAPGAPLVFPEHGSNIAFTVELGSEQVSFDQADHVLRATFMNQRLAPVPLEANGAFAVPDASTDLLTVFASTQRPFLVRATIADALGLPHDGVRVIAPTVGGGFGAKGYCYPETVAIAAVARQIDRKVAWTESRSENLLAMTHGRGQLQEVEVGARRDGTIVALRVEVTADAGAYPGLGAFLPTLTGHMASGAYAIPMIGYTGRAVVTNTTPTHAYRGAGRPEATALIERTIDLLARELRLDPVEIRRRNLIESNAFPYRTATGASYDSGDYVGALERLVDVAEYDELRRDQQRRRESDDSPCLGLGLATFVELTAGGPTSEYASVRVTTDGTVVVAVGTADHGQGHRTAFAQLASAVLRVPITAIRIEQGDTAATPRGEGTLSSRSVQLAGSAIHRAATRLLDPVRTLAADLLDATVENLVCRDDGTFAAVEVQGRSVDWMDIQARAVATGIDLKAESDFDQGGPSYPSGAHLAVVEVDRETGAVRLCRYVAVDDCGRVVNPMLVEGQIHGGIAQGFGQALLEWVVFDEVANPLSGSMLTYAIPSADVLPSFETHQLETPSPMNPLGAKGAGESGTIGATVAIQNAVIDAVAHLGVSHIDLPLSPERVWRAIRAAEA